MTRSTPLKAALLASLVLACISAAAGFMGVPAELTLAERAGLVLECAGRLLIPGLLFGLLLFMLVPLVRPAQRLDLAWLTLVAVLSLLFEQATWDLLDGARISQHKEVGLMKVGLRLGGPAAIAVGLWLLRWFVFRLFSRVALRAWWCVSIGALAAAALLAHRDATWLIGLYPGLHALLAGSGLFMATLGCCMLLARPGREASRGSSLAIPVLAACVFVGALGLQRLESFERARAASDAYTRAAAPFRGITEPVFNLVRPRREHGSADVTALLEAVRKAAATDLTATLDQRLPRRREFNLLIVAMDTVRWDHTGLGGYTRHSTTPRLNRFAESAFLFRNAYTPYPTSNYAYNSVFTGLAAGTTPLHAYRSRFGWTWDEDIHYPRLLAKAGVRSEGMAAFERKDRLNERFFGYVEKGFDAFNVDQTFDRPMTGAEITASAQQFLASRRGKPFCGFVHWLDPHDPYETREGFEFGADSKDRYDSEIAWTDAQFGKLLDTLDALGLAENTIVAAFSDHGEALGDHGLTTHNSSLFECEVHVPLVVRVPGLAGGAISTTVSLIDLMPTLLALRGDKDTQPRMGLSLLPWMIEPGQHPERMAFAEQFTVRQDDDYLETRCVVRDGWKLIEAVERPDSTFRLFHIAADPAETRNLFTEPEHEGRRAEMLGFLRAAVAARQNYRGDASANDPATLLTAETRKLLADLEGPDATKSRAAGSALRNALRNRYGELSERHARLDPGLLDALRAAAEKGLLASLGTATPRFELAEVLQVLERPESVPFWREILQQPSATYSTIAAAALAALGDASGKERLRGLLGTLNDPILAFPVVLALATLGEPTPIANYALILRGDSTPETAPLLKALTKAGDPAGLATLMDRLVLNTLHDYRLKSLAAQYAARIQGPMAERLLAFLADDADPGLRNEAAAALAKLRPDVDAVLQRVRLEREGINAQMNGKAPLARSRYEAYIAAYPDAEARIFLGLARALMELGDRAALRAALTEMERRGDVTEKEAARRMLAHADHVKWFFQPDAGEWDAEITEVAPPEVFTRNRSYWLRLKLTNKSKVYWPGGVWVFAPELRTDIVDKEGTLFRKDAGGNELTRREIMNHLPLEGVLPGESVELLLLGHVPSGRWENGRIVLGFHQHGTAHIPPSGRWIWTSPGGISPR